MKSMMSNRGEYATLVRSCFDYYKILYYFFVKNVKGLPSANRTIYIQDGLLLSDDNKYPT